MLTAKMIKMYYFTSASIVETGCYYNKILYGVVTLYSIVLLHKSLLSLNLTTEAPWKSKFYINLHGFT